MALDLDALNKLKITPEATYQKFDSGEKYWSVGAESNLNPKGRIGFTGTDLQIEYGATLEAERDLEERRLGRRLTPNEQSKLRLKAGNIYINRIEQEVSGVRGYFRTGNPAALKINPKRGEVVPEDTGIFSSNPTRRQEQKRTLATTGRLPDGTFADGGVLRDAQKMTHRGTWPKGKSLQGFIDIVNRSWSDADIDARLIQTETGVKIQKGHVTPASSKSGIISQGGANLKQNLVNQPGWADKNLTIGDTVNDPDKTGVLFGKELSANVPQQNLMIRHPDDAEMAGLGGNLRKGFHDYLISDDPNIIDFSKMYTPTQRGEQAHQWGKTAEGLQAEHNLQNRQDANQAEIDIANYKRPKNNADNPSIPKQTEITKLETVKNKTSGSKGLMKLVKNTLSGNEASIGILRNVARAGGMANNPLVNLAGDIVGASIDGAAVFVDPSSQNIIDFTLSVGQVALTTAGFVVAAIPVPGARPGAFAIMKIGDTLGTTINAQKIAQNIDKAQRALTQVEKMWGWGREGRGWDGKIIDQRQQSKGLGGSNILKLKKQ